MKRYLIDLLKKNEKLWTVYVVLSELKHGNREVTQYVLYRRQDPEYTEIHSYGDKNRGKVICYISAHNGYGFWAEINHLLTALYYSELHGFTPCVMWGEKFAYYETEGIDGIKNGFEYYFEPITVEDMWHSYAVMECSEAKIRKISAELQIESYRNLSEDSIEKLGDIFRKYVHIRQELNGTLIEKSSKLLSHYKCIGVHYRGTDFRKGYYKHPKGIEVRQTLEAVTELMRQTNATHIFLATDDTNALIAFEDFFGDKVLYFQDVIRGNEDESVAFSKIKREKHHYKLGLEVLLDTYTLSKCDYLVAGLSQVSRGAQIMKASRGETFIKTVIIDNGINQNGCAFER